MKVNAYAAETKGAPLKPFQYELGDIGAEDVDIAVSHCGICHSDLSMLDFANRHGIAPQIETFPMSRVNDALEKLRSGQPRYRILLENDL